MSSIIQKFVEVKAEGSLTYFDVALDLLRQASVPANQKPLCTTVIV